MEETLVVISKSELPLLRRFLPSRARPSLFSAA